MDENIKQQEKVLAGIVGAFLFSLIGGVLYFFIYQIGFIAGICGLVIVILASFGYQLFSGKKNSYKAIVVSVILLIVVLFIAEYISLSYAIYDEFKSIGISFFDAVEATPEFLKDTEVLGAFIKDLLIAYALGAVASFTLIRNKIQESKNAKARESADNAAKTAASVAEAQTNSEVVTEETTNTEA